MNPLSSSKSIEEIPPLTSLSDSQLKDVVVILGDWVRFNRGPCDWLFKLENVTIRSVVEEYVAKTKEQSLQPFTFNNPKPRATVNKVSFYLDAVQEERMLSWYRLIFGNDEKLPWKSAEEWKAGDQFKEPRKHKPIKLTGNGDSYMQITAPASTIVKYAYPDISNGSLKSTGFISDFNLSKIETQVADLFVRITDVWKKDGCIGLKMEIIQMNVKNKLM